MNRYKYIIVALLVCFPIYFLFFSKENIANYPSSGEGIVAFGDSLVEGVGASPSLDFVSLLSLKTGRQIVNFGLSGDTTSSARDRLPEVFARVPNPEVAIILLGGNDFLRKIPQEETFRNLEFIINEFQKRGSVVLLLGVRGGILNDRFDKDFKKLSDRLETAFVPNVLKGIIGNPKFMYDSIHPNGLGYEHMAERILPVLSKIIID